MQTIASTEDARGRAIKRVLATVNFDRCAALAPSVANPLWNRKVKLPLLGLPGNFSTYPIPYEWSVANSATDKTEKPAPVIQNGLRVNFFTALTQTIVKQSIFKQWHSFSQNNAVQALIHKHNQLASKQDFENVPKTVISITKHFPVTSDGFHSFQEKNKPINLLQALLKHGSVIQMVTTSGDGSGFVNSKFQKPANKILKTMTTLPTGFAVLMSRQQMNHTQRLFRSQKSLSNTVAVESLQRFYTASSDTQKAIQHRRFNSDQPVQQLIKSLVQHSQTQQQNQQQQQKTLETIERQFYEANQYNYRELQSLQRNVQEIKKLFGQQQKQTVTPRIKPPSFFGPL